MIYDIIAYKCIAENNFFDICQVFIRKNTPEQQVHGWEALLTFSGNYNVVSQKYNL